MGSTGAAAAPTRGRRGRACILLANPARPPPWSPRAHARSCPPCYLATPRYIRHPGYLGWFVWAIAGQLLLANPLCAVAFAYVVSITPAPTCPWDVAHPLSYATPRRPCRAVSPFPSRTPHCVPRHPAPPPKELALLQGPHSLRGAAAAAHVWARVHAVRGGNAHVDPRHTLAAGQIRPDRRRRTGAFSGAALRAGTSLSLPRHNRRPWPQPPNPAPHRHAYRGPHPVTCSPPGTLVCLRTWTGCLEGAARPRSTPPPQPPNPAAASCPAAGDEALAPPQGMLMQVAFSAPAPSSPPLLATHRNPQPASRSFCFESP